MFDPISGDPNVSAFGAGMARRAVATPGLNLVNASAPPNWVMSDTDFDLMLSIWTDDDDWRDKITKTIGDMTPGTFCTLTDDRIFDGHSFKTNQVYFGFEDNISQPIIAGSPFDRPSDGGQDEVDPSAFLIGTGADIYGAQPFSPARLGLYGCFAGFLVIRQEVEAFAQQVAGLAGSMSQFGVTDPNVQQEALMASMCGRWRDGTSLAVFPINGNDMPPADPDRTMLNDFLYAPDDGGAICPIGSHMRRANMRLRSGDPTLGFPGAPSMPHRIMRRAMPYQIPYEPENRDDPATERGLVGMFLGTSLLQQFEQVFGQWINAQFFTDLELADTVMGAPDPGCVTGPGADQPTIGADVTSCVAIKAAAYVFYPGIDGIRFVAGA
jgi:deferrochelatase/peroxidase EfeB